MKKRGTNSGNWKLDKINQLLNSKRSTSRLKFPYIESNLLNSKRSQSQVISSILLILLVIAATVIISGVVISVVQKNLAEANCLDVAGKVEISDGYTCYNEDSSPKEMQVQVHIEGISDLIDGFAIEVGGASSNSHKILNNITIDGIKMCNQSTVLYIPGNNEERTYAIDSADMPTSIRVYPILKGGKPCSVSDSVTKVQECIIQSKKCT